ncbi:MAG: TrkA family potassium uptake protein [Gammaproteobacteria bacterium]|nr:TrkA family potassium uptake protein [Gammaproteobacteria bacterium]
MHIVIIGCGRVGSSLAKILSREGYDVVIVDKKQSSFRRLGNSFNGLTICGSGFNHEVLKTAGIEKADAFCALTNGDNTNLMAAQVAKKIFHVPKVIARVYDPQRAEIFSAPGLNIISGTSLIAAMIRDKIIEERFSSYLIETGDLGVIKIEPKEFFLGKTVSAVNVPDEFKIIALIRNGSPILPQPETIIEANDSIIGAVRIKGLEKIKKRFKI